MGILMIATIFDGRKHVGFRLIDSYSREIRDVSYSSVQSLIAKGGNIQNLKIEGNKIDSIDGNVFEYPKVVNGRLVGRASITILEKSNDGNYLISTWEGDTIQVQEDTLTGFKDTIGITNCKVVHVPYGGGSDIIEKKIMLHGQTYKDILKQFEEEKRQKYIISQTKAENINNKLEVIGSEYYVTERLELKVCDKIKFAESVIKIPNVVKIIPDKEFEGVGRLTDLLGGEGLHEIGIGCFNSCNSLARVDLSKTRLESIGHRVFHNCRSLEQLNLPDSIKTIGMGAFCNCKITELKLPVSTKQILDRAFYRNKELEYIEWNDEIRTIGEEAFTMAGIKEVILPVGVTMIGAKAFSNCTKLSYLYIPESVKSLSFDFLKGIQCDLFVEMPKRLYTKPLQKMIRSNIRVKTY